MDYSRIILLFTIYSFVGWLVETIYCSLIEGEFVYRGFLNGPFCPIYGFGALSILLFLDGFKANPLILFVASMVITSILEYITSYLLEKFFNMKWWDYSNKRFNINGRVCLLNSTLFGFLSMFLIEIAHPVVSRMINNMGEIEISMYSSIFIIYFASDTIFTIISLLDLKSKLRDLAAIDIELAAEEFEEEIKELNEKWNIIKEKHEREKKDRRTRLDIDFSNRRLVKAYSNLKSKRHPKSIENLREIIKRSKKIKKDE